MRLLAISSHGGGGGAELTFASFLEHRPAEVEPRIIVIGDGPLARRLEQLGERPRLAVGYEGRPTLARAVRFTRMLREVVRRERPAIIWAMGIKAALLAAPAGRLAGVPVVWHKVDFSYDRSLARPTAAAVSGIIGVSEAVLDGLGPLRRKRLGVVFPPVSLAPAVERGAEWDGDRIAMLGRLTPYKGCDQVIRAAALLRGEFPGLRLTIAGEEPDPAGGYREALLRLSGELDVADAVELPGRVEPSGLLPRLAVLVNATHRDASGFGLEGLSGAMLEASWAGVPVVATRGGGTAEGLVDGVTGTLVDRPEPQLLASAIGGYLRDRELNLRTGEAGKRFARDRCEPAHASRRLFELLGGLAS